MRDYLIEKLYECSKKPYQKYFKKMSLGTLIKPNY